MRGDPLLGVLGALGLVGSVSAQGHAHPSGSSGSRVGNGTCPVPKPTTVFVTVTPAFLPTVFSTVFSTVISTVAPATGKGSPKPGNPSLTGPVSWSPLRTITIPCSSSLTDTVPWSTGFLTLTLPPAPGQNASSVLTSTIVTPVNPNPIGLTQTPPENTLGTLTITLEPSIPDGGYGGSSSSQALSSATPRVITITGTNPDGPSGQGGASVTTLITSPIPPGPFGVSSSPTEDTTIESASEGNESGGSPLPTITITAPSESPSDGGQGGGQGGSGGQNTPATIITVPPHQSINGPGGQGTSPIVITIFPPQSIAGPGSSGGQETSPCPESVLGSSRIPSVSPAPEVLTIFGNPPTGNNGGSSSILTVITMTSPPESPSGDSGGPNGGSNGGSPALPTITLTIPESSLEGPSSKDNSDTFTPPPLTSFVPGGPSEGPSASGNGGSPALPTITLTIPGGSSEGPSGGSNGGNPTSPANTVTVPGEPTGNGGSLSILPPVIGSNTGPAGPGESGGQGSPGIVTISSPPQSSQSGQDSPGIITISGPLSPEQSIPGVITIASSFSSGGYGAPPPFPTVNASSVSPGESGSRAISGSSAISRGGATSGSNPFTGSNAASGTGPNSRVSPTIGSAPPWANITRVTTISDAPTRTKTIKSWTPIASPPLGTRNSSISCSETLLGTRSSVPPEGSSTSSRGPLSSVPSSGWNLTTSTSQQALGTGSPSLTSPCSETFTGSTTIFSTSCLEMSAFGLSTSVVWPPPCSVPVSCSSGMCTIMSTLSTSLPIGSLTPTTSAKTTSCTDETDNPRTKSGVPASGADPSISIPLMPSLPPPVSPAGSLAEAPVVTAPPQPSASDVAFELPLPQLSALLSSLESSQVMNISVASIESPASCISMTTLEMSTITFSWCAQVATSAAGLTATASPTADLDGMAQLSIIADPSAEDSPPSVSKTTAGAYVFNSPSVAQRLPATYNSLPKARSLEPSTLSTVIVRSSNLNQDRPTKTQGPTAAFCGNPADSGNFTLNFDDLPPLGVGSGVDPHDVKPVPMFSPYHRFWFSPGFDRLPPPPDPFDPSSGKLMLQFTPASISNITEPEVPLDAAKISVGPRSRSPCFPFNFYGISLGCDSKYAPCVFNFTGLRFDYQSKQETTVVSQTANVSACPTTENCKLSPVKVSGFDGLTSVLITSKLDGEDKTWWADDLALGWFDNSCKQAVCRSKVRNTTRKRDMATKELEDDLAGYEI